MLISWHQYENVKTNQRSNAPKHLQVKCGLDLFNKRGFYSSTQTQSHSQISRWLFSPICGGVVVLLTSQMHMAKETHDGVHTFGWQSRHTTRCLLWSGSYLPTHSLRGLSLRLRRWHSTTCSNSMTTNSGSQDCGRGFCLSKKSELKQASNYVIMHASVHQLNWQLLPETKEK